MLFEHIGLQTICEPLWGFQLVLFEYFLWLSMLNVKH